VVSILNTFSDFNYYRCWENRQFRKGRKRHSCR